MYSESLFSTLHIEIKHKKRHKKCIRFSFVSSSQFLVLVLVFFFTYASWSTRFISLELCVGFSIPSFLSVLSKLIFLFNKNMDCLPLKLIIPFKIKTIEKPHSFAPRPSSQIFKLHQGVLKIQWYCVSWSFPKTCQETNFSNLNRSFEYATFSHVTDMKSHPAMKLVLLLKKSVYTWIPFERKPLVEY